MTGSSTTNQVGGLIGLIQFIHVPDNASFSLSSTATSAVTSDVTVSGQNDLGGAIGEIVNVVGPVSVTSIRSDATVIGASSSSSFAGGIVGLVQHGGAGANFSLTLSSVTNTGTVQQGNYVGGVVGYLAVTGSSGNIFPATLDTLVSTGDVETFSKISPATSNGIGGLIGNMSGTNFSTVTLSNSLASGNVNSLGQTGVGVMGGLVGVAGCGANTSCTRSITSSIATGHVTAAQDGGGFIGDYDNCSGTSVCALDIAQSYSTGTVTDDAGGTYFGGFIGCVINPSNASFGNLTIANSYTTSPVVSTEGGSNYGGFIGRILNAGITTIETSYADGVLSGPVAGTGFVQTNDGTLDVTDTYSLSSNPDDGYATALSNEAFVDAVNYATNFVGFDFTAVWYPPDGSNPPTLW